MWCADGSVCPIPTGQVSVNSTTGNSWSGFVMNSGTAQGTLFVNGPTRTADGGANILTLRNKAGMRLVGGTGEGVQIVSNEDNTNTLTSVGRLHLTSSNNDIYLLPKGETVIGNEWGGTGNLSVRGRLNVGNWSIFEENGQLVINRSNAPNESDQAHVRISADGNIWTNRSTSRGWLADMIGTKVGYNDNVSISHYAGRGALQAADGWDARTSNNPNGDWEKWRIGRRT